MIASPLFCRRVGIGVIYVVLGASCLSAQQADLPASIRSALSEYAALRSLAVAWGQTIETTPVGREKVAAEVLDKVLHDEVFIQQLAFCDGRIYMRRETKGCSSWPPRTEEVAFDGELLYAGHNLFYINDLCSIYLNDRPYLHKWRPSNDQPEACYFWDDYFRAAGVRLPTQIKELMLPWHPQSELLAFLAGGGRIETVSSAELDDRPLVRVQVVVSALPENSTPLQRYDFYLDPERGHALRRLESRNAAGHLLARSDCTEFEQLSGGSLWLPRRCRVEEYAFPAVRDQTTPEISSSPLYIKKICVNAFDAQPWPDDRFRLKRVASGAYVNDASFPEITGKDGVFYQVPANLQRLEEVIALQRARYQGWKGIEKRSRPLRILFLALNGVGVVSFTVYLIVRRRKKAREA